MVLLDDRLSTTQRNRDTGDLILEQGFQAVAFVDEYLTHLKLVLLKSGQENGFQLTTGSGYELVRLAQLVEKDLKFTHGNSFRVG
jgi:hypothetical protein